MSRTLLASVAQALRVLASPVSVVSLLVLVLNDHVLKQAWPGLVTGKLSDVAGLVVAPLLLAVLLAAVSVRRPAETAVAITGAGFVLAKTSATGAAVTSAVWSLTGVPTLIRADVTDLLALPALGVAWWVDRRVRRSAALPWRRVTSLALGMAVLPVAVLGTAATSCEEDFGLTDVSRVEGDFPGRPQGVEQRLHLGSIFASDYTIDSERRIERSRVELTTYDQRMTEQCDPTSPARCWRISPEGVGVEHSTDGGVSWSTELEITLEQAEVLLKDLDDSCGTGPRIAEEDLAVLPTDGEPVVVLTIGRVGAYVREANSSWQLHPVSDFREIPAIDTGELPRPQVTPLDQPPDPDEGQGGRPRPTCPSPTPTTVTPNPSNGPPTTYLTCP